MSFGNFADYFCTILGHFKPHSPDQFKYSIRKEKLSLKPSFSKHLQFQEDSSSKEED